MWPDPPSDGDRLGLVGESQAAFERAAVLDLAAQRGEETRPLGAVGLGKSIESGFEHVDPFGVDLAEGAEPPAAVGQCRRDQPIGVAEFSCASGRLQEGLAERGDAAWRWAVPRPINRSMRTAGSTPSPRGRPAPAPGRSSARRRRERAPPARLPRPAGQYDDGLVAHPWACGEEEVTGELPDLHRRAVPVQPLDGLAHGFVQPVRLSPPDVLIEGVLDEGVREAVAAGEPASSVTRAACWACSRRSMRSSSSTPWSPPRGRGRSPGR